MENRNTQIHPENKEEAPAVQPSPDLNSTKKKTDLESTVSVSQVGGPSFPVLISIPRADLPRADLLISSFPFVVVWFFFSSPFF